MKLFKFLPFALAITAMVGCSDDNFVETPGDSGILEEGGTVTVNISLPSTSVRTRAAAEGEQEEETPIGPNGHAGEYAVQNGTIVLFDADKKVIVKQVFTGEDLK